MRCGTRTQVYFIKPVGLDGPIKIGCSRIPADRLITLTLWSPFPLEIIGSTQGSYADERFLHQCFANWHSHAEWFHPASGLREEIARILERGISYARENLTPIGKIRHHTRSEASKARMSKSMREAWAKRKRRLAEKTENAAHAS